MKFWEGLKLSVALREAVGQWRIQGIFYGVRIRGQKNIASNYYQIFAVFFLVLNYSLNNMISSVSVASPERSGANFLQKSALFDAFSIKNHQKLLVLRFHRQKDEKNV